MGKREGRYGGCSRIAYLPVKLSVTKLDDLGSILTVNCAYHGVIAQGIRLGTGTKPEEGGEGALLLEFSGPRGP